MGITRKKGCNKLKFEAKGHVKLHQYYKFISYFINII